MESLLSFSPTQFSQFTAILLTGLLAGLFYAYDCSVTKALGDLDDDTYLRSFQSINHAIQNPYFFASFMGSLLALPLATWLVYKNGDPTAFYLLLCATLVYATGAFGVTVFGNVPLNEQLAKFPISTATAAEMEGMRKVFEKPWNTLHTIRTIASIVSFGLAILSAIVKNEL